MLTLLSAPLALLAALVIIVMVVAVRGDLAFLREVEHEAHHRNVEVVELNGDFLQIALHSYVTARYNAAFGELGATGYGLRGALHHGKASPATLCWKRAATFPPHYSRIPPRC